VTLFFDTFGKTNITLLGSRCMHAGALAQRGGQTQSKRMASSRRDKRNMRIMASRLGGQTQYGMNGSAARGIKGLRKERRRGSGDMSIQYENNGV
jgi:hypothetical protein